MQSFLSSICCLVVLLLASGYCWAQKGGLPAGQYGLANQSKSPARQIQSSVGGRPSPFASSGPSTSGLSAPTPLSSPALSQQQEQDAPEAISQQFDDANSAAVLANTRGRGGGGGFDSSAVSGFSSGGGGGGGDDGGDGGEGHPAPEPYSFSYSVNDEENGSEVSREESQDAAGNIVGFYHIRDNEGRMRRVDYTAGPEGFRATIRSNEEGLANKDSADAKYEVDEVPADRQNQAAAAAASRAQAARGGPASSGGGATGSISGFSPGSGSAIGSGGATSLAASFGEDQSAYALAAGQRRKPLTSGPIGQIQQEETLQDDFDDGQSPPPQTLSRIPSAPAPQPSPVARPQPPAKRPMAGIQRPQPQPLSNSILPKQPSPRPSASFPAKRPLSSPSPSAYQSPSRSQPLPSRPVQSKGAFAAKPFQAHEQQMFEQQKNEEVPSRSFSSPSSAPSLASYSSNTRPMPGSFGGGQQTQPQQPQPQRLEQQRQPIPSPQMFQYEDQQQQQEMMQQQQAQLMKRWTLPLNFFLPQAYRRS